MQRNVLKRNPVVSLDSTSVFAKKERQEKIASKRVCYLNSLDLVEFLLDTLVVTNLSKRLINKLIVYMYVYMYAWKIIYRWFTDARCSCVKYVFPY